MPGSQPQRRPNVPRVPMCVKFSRVFDHVKPTLNTTLYHAITTATVVLLWTFEVKTKLTLYNAITTVKVVYCDI